MQNQTEVRDQKVRILITGQNSYLGRNTDQYLQQYNAAQGRQCYQVDRISLRDETWKSMSFSDYDSIFHMVGIAHADIGKVSEEEKDRYYAVNCDLAAETAKKAKEDGVRQFVYMSSVIVYGNSAGVGREKRITADTATAPANFYGDSKVRAEQELLKLSDENFRVAIVRLPLVYGKGCRGNFPMLEKLAEKLPMFPTIRNQRSMIYIENLGEFLRILADSGEGGIFFPQNREYVSTCDMVVAIAAAKGKRIRPCGWLNLMVVVASRMPGKIGKLADKAFGSLTIDWELSKNPSAGYCRYTTDDSILKIYRNE